MSFGLKKCTIIVQKVLSIYENLRCFDFALLLFGNKVQLFISAFNSCCIARVFARVFTQVLDLNSACEIKIDSHVHHHRANDPIYSHL